MAVDTLAQAFRSVRQHTLLLAAPLSVEDCCVQSMPDASPIKWHLGHTSWFFETFVLERWEAHFKPFDPAFRVLFNSYYNAVGDKHPRAQRGMLTRPSLDTVKAYRANVDERLQGLLNSSHADAEWLKLIELGLHHEQQHQELMLTDVKHLLSLNPLLPAYSLDKQAPTLASGLDWLSFAGGLVEVGHGGDGFCFDNELPRHQVWLQPYQLASRLVTNGEYRAFVDAGGYANPDVWLAAGWDWRVAQKREQPLYWRHRDGAWHEFTLAGLMPLDALQPVVHLSYYEADAYARWAGARLPTEFEWEHSVRKVQDSGQALSQLFDHAWQWTSSAYAAYPGFHPSPGAVGEYNGKFMVNQYVLRGGSVATPPGHARSSYRNFFPAEACWQFSGLRLARD